MNHNPVFTNFKPWSGQVDSFFTVNFLGVLTKNDYICNVDADGTFKHENPALPGLQQFIQTDYPSADEGYFEWINVLESVVIAKDNYCIIELGAGIGPHLVNAGAAIRLYHGNKFPFYLVGVEGEPTCFQWMNEHLKYNNITPASHKLIEAVISEHDGEVLFEIGYPRGYGSYIVKLSRYITSPLRWLYRFFKRNLKRLSGEKCQPSDYWTGKKGLGIHVKKVKAISLNTILLSLDKVDLLHIDINGAEYVVLKSAQDLIIKKVKRIHIGTHNKNVEKLLRIFFQNIGWKCLFDYPGRTEHNTEYGKIKFADGVQTWLNPKLS